MDVVDHVAAIPLFEGLPRHQYENLARIAATRVYDRDQTIFLEGDDGRGFYVVLSGRVKIFKLSPDGKEQILHLIEPGEPFGEVAVFTGRSYPAFAAATSKTTALFVPRDAFIELIKNDPLLALNMLAVLSRRLRQFTQLVEDLSLKEVPARLAAYLLYLSDREHGAAEVELDITKGQLASVLGTIPETLSRVLSRMNRESLIEMEGSRIRIIDEQGLRQLSQSRKKVL